MFIVHNRYWLINSADGWVGQFFDNGSEEKMAREIKDMLHDDFKMNQWFIYDSNNQFSPLPAMVWFTINDWDEKLRNKK